MQHPIDASVDAIGTALLGKGPVIRKALCCLLAGGHLLLEDMPGVGKTTLAHALARVLGLSYGRVQFTADLLPADILGMSVFDREGGRFQFHPGPIFHQVLLADEINRATPRTQSALLEAMAEGQVSIDGETRALAQPFFVIATQNPVTQAGTYPLPESQLDRFLMRLSLGYPHPSAERQLLLAGGVAAVAQLATTLTAEQLQVIRQEAAAATVSDSLLNYVQRLIAFTRERPEFALGLSPRGALALMAAARTWAVMESRSYVIPEDVQQVLAPVVAHRVLPSSDYAGDGLALVGLLERSVDVVAS